VHLTAFRYLGTFSCQAEEEESQPYDTAILSILRKLDAGAIRPTQRFLQALVEELEWRIEAMGIATELLKATKLALPAYKYCSCYDKGAFQVTVLSRYSADLREKYDMALQELLLNPRITAPGTAAAEEDGGLWGGAHRYLAAAITENGDIDDLGKLENAVQRLGKK
jgi:hypothetical protein